MIDVSEVVTVKLVLPEIPELLAEIVVLPDAIPCASPPEPMVATAVTDECQATEFVISAVVPLL